jgi:hypothetical protein
MNVSWLHLQVPLEAEMRGLAHRMLAIPTMGTPGRRIADEILAYLVEHPEAQDTVEGITEWWLLEQRIRGAVAEVEGALHDLVANDLLVARRCPDGRTYYGLNRAREREIRRHLRNGQSAGETDTDSTQPQT